MATTSVTSSAPGAAAPKPNRRQHNPLSLMSSYTYHLTLYMVSPDAYNEYILTDRKNIRTIPGVYVIAQSGGTPVNNDPAVSAPRAPGFELDYYIDDVKFSTAFGQDGTLSTSEVTFSIYEPYGFSLVTNLKKASDAILAESKLDNIKYMQDPKRQFFVMSISFMGYDAAGNVMTPAAYRQQVSALGEVTPDSGQLFEHTYDLQINTFKFKLEGKATRYDIKMASLPPATAFGLKLGMVENDTRVIAHYVDEAIGGANFTPPVNTQGLLTIMNNENKKIAEKTTPVSKPTVYSIEWQGDEESIRALKKATIVNPTLDSDKRKFPPAQQVKDASMSNEATAQKSGVDPTKRMLVFKEATSVMKAIEAIIKQSSYVTDALKVLQASKEETDPVSPNDGDGGSKPFKWYSLGAKIEAKEWSPSRQDFIYNITYIIRPYSVPSIPNSLLSNKSVYYGAHKRYEYWFSGKNSEITHFDQTFDNTYFNTVVDAAAPNSASSVPNYSNKQTDQDQQGKLGDGLTAQNSITTYLNDPAAYSKSKIKILGDPDYLVQDSPASLRELYNEFYGADGFTINPVSGQVFMEIAFYEATDYKNSTGLLNVNKKIQMFPYTPEIQTLLNGATCYQINNITSVFSKGSFTQEIDASIHEFAASGSAGVTATGPTSATDAAAAGRGASADGTAGEAAAQANAATAGLAAPPATSSQQVDPVTGVAI